MTGIFYGSTMGTTEAVAQDIAKQMGVAAEDIHNVAEASVDDVDKYDLVLFGCSTWGSGELQDDMYTFMQDIQGKSLSGKKVALFGCGDSGSYPDTFCDAVAEMHASLEATGCTFIGSFEPVDYEETGSRVCQDGKFIGLAIDESDSDKTDARIAAWCQNLK